MAAPFHPSTLPRPIQESWLRVDVSIGNRQWSDAVQRLIPLLKRVEPEWVVEKEKDRAVGFRRYCAEKISAWPEEAKRVYEEAVADELKEAVRIAKINGDLLDMTEIIGRFPLGHRDGMEARWLERDALDQGDDSAARRWGLRMFIGDPLPVVRSMGAVSWQDQTPLSAETPDAVWTQGDRLIALDRVGRVRTFDFQGMIVRETPPPAAKAKWRGPVLTAQDVFDGGVYVGQPTPSPWADQWEKWPMRWKALLQVDRPNDPITTHLLIVRPFPSAAEQKILRTGWTPLGVVARRGVVWMGGMRKQHVGLWRPTVAKFNEQGEKVWEVGLGEKFCKNPNLWALPQAASMELVCSGDGEHLGVLMGSSWVLMRAGSGEIEWIINLDEDEFQPPDQRPGRHLILDRTVMVALPGGKSVVEVERRDGRVLWRRSYDPAENMTLVTATAEIVILCQRRGVEGVKRRTGERLWQYTCVPGSERSGTPWVLRESVLVPIDSRVIQLELVTGREHRAWPRIQAGPCVFREGGPLLYGVTPLGFDVWMDEGHAARLEKREKEKGPGRF